MAQEEKITVRIKIDEDNWKEVKRMAVEMGDSVQDFAGDLIGLGAKEISTASEGLIKIEKPKSGVIIEIDDIDDYEKALKLVNPTLRYMWSDSGLSLDGDSLDLISYEEREELETTYDSFLQQGVLHSFYIPGKYPSLDEYRQIVKEGFKEYDSILYKAIRKHGFLRGADFNKARGECNTYRFLELLDAGYTTYKDFKEDAGDMSLVDWLEWSKEGFNNHKEVEEAKNMEYWMGSNSYEEYTNAKKGGFTDINEFAEAKEKGFNLVKEWEEFNETDFSNRDEFLVGKKLGIKDPKTVKVYRFLSTYPPGRAIAISKIVDEADIYESDLEDIFKEASIKKLGKYDASAETFIRSKIVAYVYECIIIDGSNVATDTETIDGEEVKKGYLKRIESAKKKAEETGLPVYVYVTAYLKNRIDDRDKLLKYIKNKEFIETTGKSEDDKFFLQHAIDENGYIISNDQYKQYKEAHPELADEIDNRRVPFNPRPNHTIDFGGKLSKIKNGKEVGQDDKGKKN